jgi:hypothetical protein
MPYPVYYSRRCLSYTNPSLAENKNKNKKKKRSKMCVSLVFIFIFIFVVSSSRSEIFAHYAFAFTPWLAACW